MFAAAIKQRDNSGYLNPPTPGTLTAKTMSYAALGGCDAAELLFVGSESACLQWLTLMRCPIEILDSHGQRWWWGYINEIKVTLGAITVGLSLDNMRNKVRVTYGNGSNTAWASNAEAQTIYGIKEFTDSISDASQTNAETRRSTILAQCAYPVTSFGFQDTQEQKNEVTISCRGWWNTFDWRYQTSAAIQQASVTGALAYAETFIWLGNNPPGTEEQFFSAAIPITIAGSVDYYADSIEFVLHQVGGGAFAGNLTVSLQSETGTDPRSGLAGLWNVRPGAVLSSVVLNNINPMDYYAADLSPKVQVTHGGHYWVVADVPGSLADPYRWLLRYDAAYTPDNYRVWLDGSGWVSPNGSANRPNITLPYRLNGVLDYTSVINTIITGGLSEFVTTTDIVDTSGKYASPYADGSQTNRQVIQNILTGGTTNNRRLLAYVTAERVLRIYEEPAPSRTSAQILVDRKGNLWQSPQAPLVESPVGRWCLVSDLTLPNLAADPLLFFIERAEFDCVANRWISIEPRDSESAWRVGGLARK